MANDLILYRMTFNKNQTYTILNRQDDSKIEIKSISNLENWYRGKIASINLAPNLQRLFDEVEQLFAAGDFKTLKGVESQIIDFQLFVEENNAEIVEIHINKGKNIFFKTVE